MINDNMINLNSKYRNIFIIDSIQYWDNNKKLYNLKEDLVLTYDLGLQKYIHSLGGEVYFIDHLIDTKRMQENNYILYEFFRLWHYDKDGNDIFIYKNIPFGFSFRLEFWNDFISYSRIYLSLSRLTNIDIKKIYLSSKNDAIVSVLKDLGISFKDSTFSSKDCTSYYFPIEQWMDEKIRPTNFRAFLYKTREYLTTTYGILIQTFDKIFANSKQTIFIQEYHPTKALIKSLRKDSNLHILLTNFSRGSSINENLKERLLPIYGSLKQYDNDVLYFMKKFNSEQNARLILDDGSDITQSIYKIIESRISKAMPNTFRTLDSSIRYLNENSVDLEILIANIGHVATLFDAVCKSKNIPSFLIINGMLASSYMDEAKYATIINAYSKSIKENYFREMDNIITLGDPRMDLYPPLEEVRQINTKTPIVTIGASGFNNIDLNSYVAAEFEFMHDILSAFQKIKNNGGLFHLIIKVRPNGYINQYKDFVKEFFSGVVNEIIDTTPMQDILKKTDFYISINSQTLFEASCLGIPVIYYKNDTEIKNSPFDNSSELVTITNVEDLIQAFYDFQNKHERYEAFLDRKVMEKYIGFLDGKNLERNKKFIYMLLEKYKESNVNQEDLILNGEIIAR
jgi:hypothetical protein